jgi:hypothetical protein
VVFEGLTVAVKPPVLTVLEIESVIVNGTTTTVVAVDDSPAVSSTVADAVNVPLRK